MRPGQNQRRPQRGRGGSGGRGGSAGGVSSGVRVGVIPLRHQVFDSNGPSVKVRGNAFQIHEKYLSLARDAASAGNHIEAENYYQHAEHYQRIMTLIAENEQSRQQQYPRQEGKDSRETAYQGSQPQETVPSREADVSTPGTPPEENTPPIDRDEERR